MAKRRGGGFRAPKDYVPRDAKSGSRPNRPNRPGRSADDDRTQGGARPGRRAEGERAPREVTDRAGSPRGGKALRGGAPGAARVRRGDGGPTEGQRQRNQRDRRNHAQPERAHDSRETTQPTEPETARLRVGSVVEQPAAPGAYVPPDDIVHERLAATVTTAPADVEGLAFADLGLGLRLVEGLTDLGATAPFPIQAATIPDALAGRDVLARARTGSGKTIAFGAAMVERLLVTRPREQRGKGKRTEGRPPRGLIIAPTRELALQIDRTVQPLARRVGLFTTQVYGGVPQQRQVGALRRGVDIVIGTPGRIEDLQRQGHLDLSSVAMTVLDEADQMADLGFLESMQRILRTVQRSGQRLLFSATLDRAVMTLVAEFLDDPAVHEVAGDDVAHADIDHHVFVVDRSDRPEVLRELAGSGGRVLVFMRTRLGAERVADELDEAGVAAVALHGDLSQAARDRNLDRFSRGQVDVLVATDVAARGLHVDDIRLVVQADAPDEYKTYLHRAGRTGRAGRHGVVVTLVAPQRQRRMEELLGRARVEASAASVRAGGAVVALQS